jgi:hypothetical protein
MAFAFEPAALGVVSETTGRDAASLLCGLAAFGLAAVGVAAAGVASLDCRTLAESLSFMLVIFQRPPE